MPPEPKSIALTSTELARQLGLTHDQIRQWRVRGQGPQTVKTEDGRVLYWLEDVQRWVSDTVQTNAKVKRR